MMWMGSLGCDERELLSGGEGKVADFGEREPGEVADGGMQSCL